MKKGFTHRKSRPTSDITQSIILADMRLTGIYLLGSVGSAFASGVGMDACWFVGMRILKTPSYCEPGTGCVAVYTTGPGSTEITFKTTDFVLPCETAVVMQTDALMLVSSTAGQIPTDSVSNKLSELIPALRNYIYTSQVPAEPQAIIRSMGEVSQALIRGAFDSSLNVLVCEYMRLIRLMADVFHTSFPVSPSDWRQQFSLLAFDIWSVSAMHVCGSHLTRGVKQLLDSGLGGPQFRPSFPSEYFGEPNAGLPTELSTHEMLLTAEAVEKLSRLPHYRTSHQVDLEFADVQRVAVLLIILDQQPLALSTAVAMLKYQLASEVCPRIDIVANRVDWSDDALRPILLGLIKFCRSVEDIDSKVIVKAAVDFQIYLTGRLSNGPIGTDSTEAMVHALKEGNIGDIGRLLEREILTVDGRLAFLTQMVDELFVLEEIGPENIFKPLHAFATERDFSDSMRGLGRLIGFFSLLGVNCGSVLRLPYVLYSQLREPQANAGLVELMTTLELVDEEEAEQDVVETELFENVHQPVLFIKMGMADVLGPLGASVFTDREWTDIFRRAPKRSFERAGLA
jgi:hypothetical protein